MFDTGNTGFMLVATSLVMLMTPGLAFFYGGLVGRKNVLSIMIQSFVSMGVTTVLWYAVGFSLCFSGGEGGIVGNLDMAFLRGIDPLKPFGNGQIPMLVFFAYQMMFAIITPALITGAFSNRVRFRAYLLFLVAWLLLVYFPFVHMVWGGGLLAKWGVLDFAGGIVVHNIAGMAALASVLFVGRRRIVEKGPHSIPLVALGNTDVAASFAAVTWLFLEWTLMKKPKFVGLLTGAVAGLATITPAAGYVSTGSAAIIGVCAGMLCYAAVSLKNRLRWDDALDVWGVHGVGGALGMIMLGLLASTAFNPNGADGLVHGGGAFFVKELLAVLISSVYALVFTYVMLWIINKVCTVKTSEAEETTLDESLHGETAYEY
jgi:Amt family ammonium transporter